MVKSIFFFAVWGWLISLFFAIVKYINSKYILFYYQVIFITLLLLNMFKFNLYSRIYFLIYIIKILMDLLTTLSFIYQEYLRFD